MRKAFTLIELLVVVSIISLLASVVIASLNSARDKGRIGAARYFESQVDHITADSALIQWDFTECSGGAVKDRSGNANAGAFSGAGWSTTDVPYGTNCSASFTGYPQGVAVANTSIASFTGNAPFTLSLWVKQASAGANQTFICSSQYLVGGYCFATGYNSSDVTFFTQPVNSGVTSAIGRFLPGVWTQLVAVYDGSKGYIYKDGSLIVSGGIGSPGANAFPMDIGMPTQGGWNQFIGKITNVRVYAKALTAMDIGKLYALEFESVKKLADR